MSAECDKCGTDLVGTQYDEGGMRCVPCDLRARITALEEHIAILGRANIALARQVAELDKAREASS